MFVHVSVVVRGKCRVIVRVGVGESWMSGREGGSKVFKDVGREEERKVKCSKM